MSDEKKKGSLVKRFAAAAVIPFMLLSGLTFLTGCAGRTGRTVVNETQRIFNQVTRSEQKSDKADQKLDQSGEMAALKLRHAEQYAEAQESGASKADLRLLKQQQRTEISNLKDIHGREKIDLRGEQKEEKFWQKEGFRILKDVQRNLN